jgi:dUTP pyrophosphatase
MIKEDIAEILQQVGTLTQAEIVEVLKGRGVKASQGSVSRALRSLGAVKSKEGYFVPNVNIETRANAEIGVKFLDPRAKMPERANGDEDVGYDLVSLESKSLFPGQVVTISTGIALEIPKGWEAQVRSRSGLASQGLFVVNSPGTIDPGYRGEVKVLLTALKNGFQIAEGQKVAQLVFKQVPTITFYVSDGLSDTQRGEKGFGSTDA